MYYEYYKLSKNEIEQFRSEMQKDKVAKDQQKLSNNSKANWYYLLWICMWISSLLVNTRLWSLSFSMDVSLCYFLNSESLSLKTMVV